VRNVGIESREVTWKVLDIPVCGTVTAPADAEHPPAVILVAGSGPTDRDWCSPLLPGTNGSGRLLAEALAGQGFLTLRYDKMASGPHVRENLSKFAGKASMQTHLDELAGAVETLASEAEIPDENLFVLTNSEGAIHAVNYQLQATRNRFKGLVLTGPPGRAVGEIARSQLWNQGKSLPNAEVLLQHYDKAIAEFLASEQMVLDPSLPEGVRRLVLSLENPANLPFARELWTYSLPQYIDRVNEPVLVVIGKKDLQTDWKVDGKALEVATARMSTMTFAYPEDANHVLKHEEIPLEKLTAASAGVRYNALDTELDEEAARTIIDWLHKQSQSKA
jgi:pimeloyl-ACP methyl ester carboxylesterase